jgi:UDP-N-acetylmuramate dehydrogenase
VIESSTNILYNFLNKKKINYIKNFELKKKSWLKVGGTFETYIQPKNIDEIKELFIFFKQNSFKYYTVGNLSNIIFRDGKIKTPIINLKFYNNITVNNNKKDSIIINASCGVSISKLVNFVSLNLRVTGMEGLVGIPGSLGGGIYMNASSYDSYISEYLKEVKFLNSDGKIINFSKSQIEFSWRKSIFHKMKNFIILNAVFEFPKNKFDNSQIIKKKLDNTKNHRGTFQEKKLPNLGSLFATKNLYGDLKGYKLNYMLLYLINKYLTKIIIKYSNLASLIYFRKILVKFYSFLFDIDRRSNFILSEKTINCLVNKGSCSSNEAIKTIRNIQKKIGYSQNLEVIIFEDIE